MFQLVQLTPSPESRRQVDERATRALYEALADAVRGEVRFDVAHRVMYAVDASNYRSVPYGVVMPLDASDVERAVAVCREHDAPLLSRGGGTSSAGQACNTAVVLDFVPHMNRILHIDAERRLARVEPGVILDDLRGEAEKHGLTFGPDPATHSHCAMGGMIGNNACGVHAVQSEFYGPGSRTSDNVRSLEVLTYEGLRLTVGATPPAELERIVAEGGRRGAIYGALRELAHHYEPLIKERFPDIPRRVSGYNLPELLPEHGFDVAKALVGSEGTCVTVLEAEVCLIPHLPKRTLVLVSYESIDRAGDHVPALRELRPVGCEAIDWRLVEFACRKGQHAKARAILPQGKAWMLVDFGADTEEESEEQAHRAAAVLRRHRVPCDVQIIADDHQREQLLELREAALGVSAFAEGVGATWEGWEDSAVPPDRLGDYLRGLMKLNERFEYIAPLYGHFAQGCVHSRANFELGSEEGRERFGRYTREAAELVLSFGGSLSGEHGDGQARGDLLPLMYGDEGVEAMRRFKHIWDPRERMNPGKLVDARPRTDDMRIARYPQAPQPETVFRFPDDHGEFAHAAMRCVGVGLCRRKEGGTMCPSWMVTHEEKHTTRGRAHLLWEMLEGDLIDDGFKSEEVKESLDLCLSCKGCKSDCPVNVDIATYKAEFMHHYYKGRLRPLRAVGFGYIYRWARLASLAPSLANALAHAPGLSRLGKKVARIHEARDIPRFAKRTFRASYRPPPRPGGLSRRVLLWPDTFNNHFQPEGLQALADVLADAGCAVDLPPKGLCCGRPLYEYGQLDDARRLLLDVLAALEPDIDAGIPVVGLEPSCVSVFRDELRSLFPDDWRAQRLSEQTFTWSEFLGGELEGYEPPKARGKVLLHGHCHDKSLLGFEHAPRLLERMGLEVEVPDSGCCGMAGGFGYEAEKYEVSVACGERVLLPRVRAADSETFICTDGFSCRSQIDDLSGRKPLTVPELMQLALRRP